MKTPLRIVALLGGLFLVLATLWCGGYLHRKTPEPVRQLEVVPSAEERMKWTIDHSTPAEAARLRKLQEEQKDVLKRPLSPPNPPEIGMSADDVRSKYGEPDSVNRAVSASGTTEQWVYRYTSKWRWAGYIYLSNGVMTSYQEEVR